MSKDESYYLTRKKVHRATTTDNFSAFCKYYLRKVKRLGILLHHVSFRMLGQIVKRNLSLSKSVLQKLIISPTAATRLTEICQADEYLRVSVGGGGCAGYSYEFELSNKPLEDSDLKFERGGAVVGKLKK